MTIEVLKTEIRRPGGTFATLDAKRLEVIGDDAFVSEDIYSVVVDGVVVVQFNDEASATRTAKLFVTKIVRYETVISEKILSFYI